VLTLTLEAELALSRGRNCLSTVMLALDLEVATGVGLANRRTVTLALLEELAEMFDPVNRLELDASDQKLQPRSNQEIA
jgi:hypothetical protein